ncbi:hypothetical protein GGR57DRAFT_452412 [Xylariaceae sp. FL1272]|nr:hypothetical protein GGR57DRAFT_452412 [Xylariaceae sp. FL1272]
MMYHDIDIPLPAFIAIDWSAMTLASVPIVLRFWLRWRDSKPQTLSRNLSDGLVVFSWLSGIVLISINTWKNILRWKYVNLPDEELYYSVPKDQSAYLLYISWISLFFIYIALWAAKFALIAFFSSVLNMLETRTAMLIVAFATFFAFSTLVLHIVLLSRWCDPVDLNWNIDGHLCSAVHDIKSVTISTVANIATDLVILTLPLYALNAASRIRRTYTTQAQVSKAEWSGFALVVAVASLSIVAALARWVTLDIVQHVPKAEITHTIDVWALVEIVSSLLAVSLPTLRSFVRKSRQGGPHRLENGSSSRGSPSQRFWSRYPMGGRKRPELEIASLYTESL